MHCILIGWLAKHTQTFPKPFIYYKSRVVSFLFFEKQKCSHLLQRTATRETGGDKRTATRQARELIDDMREYWLCDTAANLFAVCLICLPISRCPTTAEQQQHKSFNHYLFDCDFSFVCRFMHTLTPRRTCECEYVLRVKRRKRELFCLNYRLCFA